MVKTSTATFLPRAESWADVDKTASRRVERQLETGVEASIQLLDTTGAIARARGHRDRWLDVHVW